MEQLSEIRQIKGIGEKTAKLFNKLSVYTVEDLLYYYPRDYEEYQPIMPIASKKADRLFTFEGFISTRPVLRNAGNLKILIVTLKDDSGAIELTWFNMPYLASKLKLGSRIIVRGKVAAKNGRLTMPQAQILTPNEYYEKLRKIQPIYSLTKGLSNNLVTKSVKQALNIYEFDNDYLPLNIRKKYDLINRSKACEMIHFPKDKEEMISARKRLAFDEFFIFSLALRRLAAGKNEQVSSYRMEKEDKVKEFVANLPYELTTGQSQAIKEIFADMKSGIVMNRLIQGDVGCGKTIVAAVSLLLVVENGYQGTLMVPTQVLAVQHYEELKKLFVNFGIKVELLTGNTSAKDRRRILSAVKNNEVDILVGTHAIIGDGVEFANLALVVTDEQHRFGVKQRQKAVDKGFNPHTLVMSATPIPRTLAIILYGDLDISVITDMPKGRQPIKNAVVDTSYREKAYAFIKRQVQEGRQAYVICPMVEENEELDIENVIDYAKKLKEVYAESITIEILHGKMKPKQKDEIMDKFAKGEINVLVSTTVVEVGVNVPNATVMMIENAERFGLAQLHQLRGRVGRGDNQSYCIFVLGTQSSEAKDRVEILSKSNDGFEIASKDLELRGPGDLFGVAQSGEVYFDIGDVFADSMTMKLACEAAGEITDEMIIDFKEKSVFFRNKFEKIAGNGAIL